MRRAFLLLLLLGCETEAPVDEDAGSTLDAAAPDAAVPELPQAFILDAEGGALILRGTNVQGSSKWSSDFLPPDYVETADFARLHDELGMNAIRFLVFWEAVEPEQGVYDEAYLTEVRRRIEAAADAGLSVIVDMHQDVFGRGFGGDGAPRWACDEALYASFERPAEWYLGYFEPEVQECFDRLYADTPMRAAFGAMWHEVATALRGARGLLAYELLNEPHWGTAIITTFESNLAPVAYAEWIDQIRAADPAPYILVPPSSAANVGTPTALVPPERERLIYAPHIYPPALEGGFGWSGSLGAALRLTGTVRADGLRMDLPVVVGELGARADVDGALRYLAQIYDALDQDRLSVMQWEGGQGNDAGYSVFDETGEPSAIGLALARPHPARTAGTPLTWSWDGEARVFSFEWTEPDGVTGDTVISLPSRVFPDGVRTEGAEADLVGDELHIPRVGGDRSVTVTAL